MLLVVVLEHAAEVQAVVLDQCGQDQPGLLGRRPEGAGRGERSHGVTAGLGDGRVLEVGPGVLFRELGHLLHPLGRFRFGGVEEGGLGSGRHRSPSRFLPDQLFGFFFHDCLLRSFLFYSWQVFLFLIEI